AAAVHPDARHHAAHLSRRRVLLDRHAAAGVAHLQPVQSRRVPHQRLPLELLRRLGGRRGTEPRNDTRLLRAVPGRSSVDLPDGVSAEELKNRGQTPIFQFAVMPRALMRRERRPASAAMNFAASSGVVMKASKAWAWNFSRSSFELSALRSAPLRRVTIAGG